MRCRIEHCTLDHDEIAPNIHEGECFKTESFSIGQILEEGSGRGWEIEVNADPGRELTLKEARDLGVALLGMVAMLEVRERIAA